MPRFLIADLVRGTRGALVGGRLEREIAGVSIDSRTCPPGAAFFAIRGVRQDGHVFVPDARARGAGAAVVADLPPSLTEPGDFPVVVVDDTTQALARLAAFHRRRHDLPVVGITGSNGKTTTKELTATVLEARFRVLKAAGSFNNQWGLPLTLLDLDATHEAAVLELGMNAFGEIAALAQIAQPSIGVVTMIAPAHLEGVGSIEGVQKAKGELVEAIPPDGVAILNGDDPLVAALASRARGTVRTYGRAADADVRLTGVTATAGGLTFSLHADSETVLVRLPLSGRHNAWNAAAAATVGLALGIPLATAAGALATARPVKGRLLWREAGGVRILDDTYNANPVSLRAALDALQEAAGPRGCAAGSPRLHVLLGDMLELGQATEAAHRDAGRWVAGLPVATFATAGSAMRLAAAEAEKAGCSRVLPCDTPEEAAERLAERVGPGDSVLVKGSRGMRMERAVETLCARLGADAPRAAC